MAALPVQAAVRGDFVVLLVLVDTEDTMDQVAEKVAHHVVDRRLPPQEGRPVVRVNGQDLPSDTTVAQAGIGPMQFIEVRYE